MGGGADFFGDDPSELRDALSLSSGELPSRSDLVVPKGASAGTAAVSKQLALQLAELERRERVGATREELADLRLELLAHDPALLDKTERIAFREQISRIPKRTLDAASAETRRRYVAEAPLVGEVPVVRVRSRRHGSGSVEDEEAFAEFEIGNIGASFRSAVLTLASYAVTGDSTLAINLNQTQDLIRRALEQNLLGPDLTTGDLADLLSDDARMNDALAESDYRELREFLLGGENRELLLQALKKQQSVSSLMQELQQSVANGDPIKEKLLRAVLATSLVYRTLEMPDFYKIVRDAIVRYLRFDDSSSSQPAFAPIDIPPQVLAGQRPPEPPNPDARRSVAHIELIPSMNYGGSDERKSSIETLNEANNELARARGGSKHKPSGPLSTSPDELSQNKKVATDVYVSWHTPEVKEVLVAYGLIGPTFYPAFVSNLFDAISHQLELAQTAHDYKVKTRKTNSPPPLLG